MHILFDIKLYSVLFRTLWVSYEYIFCLGVFCFWGGGALLCFFVWLVA